MTTPTVQHIWILAEHPSGPVTDKTFRLDTVPLPALKPNQALVAIDYLSNDPAFRHRINKGVEHGSEVGETLKATAVATVLKSTGKWKEGQNVFGWFGWYDYGVVDDADIKTVAAELPGKPWASIAPLGYSSLTAHQGIIDVLKVGPKDVVLVAAAAGSVGSAAVQIARNVGAKRVVGIAGGPEKCAWVVENLKADACVDYKADDFEAKLKAALPEGANKYYDMVGGRVFDVGLANMAEYGEVCVIGAVSTYNTGPTYVPQNTLLIASKQLTIRGASVFHYGDKAEAAFAQIAAWIKKGTYNPDGQMIVDGTIEQVPSIWEGLFKGANTGKLITRLKRK